MSNTIKTVAGPSLCLGTAGITPHFVMINDSVIEMREFLEGVVYVLKNTDLVADDPRLDFVRYVGHLKQVDGFNKGGQRLQSQMPTTQTTKQGRKKK